MKADLIHSLERTIVICATRDTVFQFFTDSDLFSQWWGEGSSIEGRPGGLLKIRYPNGVLASGEVLEVQAPERIVFTYGYESGSPIQPGESVVTITLQEDRDGTRLHLRHDFSDQAVRDEHVQGWRYQLALFSNVASREQHSHLSQSIDAYFQLWNTLNPEQRLQNMRNILEEGILFQDKHSCTHGMEDLNLHLSAYQRFMPGMTLQRDGEIRECQGTAIVRWIANKKDGSRIAAGLNVFALSPEGKIRTITGFWD
jgi:uncharacterized protein YndB with AHSA1/START domain